MQDGFIRVFCALLGELVSNAKISNSCFRGLVMPGRVRRVNGEGVGGGRELSLGGGL